MAFGYIVDSPVLANGFNYVGAATVTATNYPAINLSNLSDARKSHACQASAKAGLLIDIDLGLALPVDCVAILGHIFSGSATIKVQASVNPAYAPLAIDDTLVWNEDQIIHLYSVGKVYRYWRINVTDAANLSFPWIGELVIGKRQFTKFPSQWGIVEGFNHENIIHTTDYDTRWIYHHTTLRFLEAFEFLKRTEAEVVELKTMFRRAKGSFTPILVVFDEDYPNKSIYGRLLDELGRSFKAYECNDLGGLSVKEEPSAGLVSI